MINNPLSPLTFLMLVFLCTTLLPKFYTINLHNSAYQHVFTSRVENSVNPDQLASRKPADLDLVSCPTKIHLGFMVRVKSPKFVY